MTTIAELPVELTGSYAQRTTAGVRLVIQVQDGLASAGKVRLVLRKGKQVLRVPVSPTSTAAATVIDATVAKGLLRPGTWQLSLASEAARPVPLQARLVYSNKQPVALLSGPVPSTTLAPPRPTERRKSSTVRGQLYDTAARVANIGLGRLPPERATRYRQVLKRASRSLRS